MSASSGTTMVPRTVSEGATSLQRLSDITWLDLSRSVIEHKDKKLLAKALENNELPNLKVLFLEGNAGDVGMTAMLTALSAGHLKGLEKIILWDVSSYNQISTAEEGTDTIAAALEAGNLPIMHTMDFTGSLPKSIPARKLSKATKELLFGCSCGRGRFLEGLHICMGCLVCTTDPEKNQTLECLRCSCGGLQVYSGDDGMTKIAKALSWTPIDSLRFLILQHNYIGDEGASSLARLLRRGKLPHLEELDLRNNPVGYRGAKEIVLAYLRNPLLTVRLKLDWPSFLLQEKAVSLRDSNLRLEYRLKKLEITQDSIVKNQFIEFDYKLERQPGAGCLRRHTHRLHLLCQAQPLKSQEVVREEDKDKEPKGIEIRNRSMFGSSSPQKNVQRDLESVDSDEEAKGLAWFLSDDSDESQVTADGAFSVLSSVAPSEHPPPGDEMTVETLGDVADNLAPLCKRTSKRPSLHKKKKTGVHRLYVTRKSCGFLGAAQALGNQSEGRDSQQKRRWLPEWIPQKLMRGYWPWQSQKRTEQQMDSIILELLMLGERKPDEFYSMFGLRQVLLPNPLVLIPNRMVLRPNYRQSYSNKYSRVWICKSCFLGYSERQAVHPITNDGEIERKVLSLSETSPDLATHILNSNR